MTGMIRFGLAVVLVSTVATRVEAVSLRVAPAGFILHDVEPGKVYDIYKETGLRLTIYNEEEVSRTWLLSTHRPSERGRWERGYGEIPDAGWIWFAQPEITVPPEGKAYGHLLIKIPDEPQYYNQHWVATLSIQGKAGAPGIGLAVNVRAQIETEVSEDAPGRPHGLLAMKPSALVFNNVAPGAKFEGEILLFNNDDKPHVYSILSLFADEEVDKRTYLRHAFEAIPDPSWITTDTQIAIDAGKSAALKVAVDVPDNVAHFGKQWEDALLISPDEGRAEFVRIQILTMEEQAKE